MATSRKRHSSAGNSRSGGSSRSQTSQDSSFMNLKKLRSLLELMSANEVSEVEITEGDAAIRIKRGNQAPIAEGPALVSVVPSAAPIAAASIPAPLAREPGPPMPPAERAVSSAEAKPDAREGEEFVEFVSPMVGTFYRAPSPEAGPYVTEGDRVDAETVLCIIEAMKVMNEIKAEVSGEVVEVLVENGEAVEYGQPLFLLKKTA